MRFVKVMALIVALAIVGAFSYVGRALWCTRSLQLQAYTRTSELGLSPGRLCAFGRFTVYEMGSRTSAGELARIRAPPQESRAIILALQRTDYAGGLECVSFAF